MIHPLDAGRRETRGLAAQAGPGVGRIFRGNDRRRSRDIGFGRGGLSRLVIYLLLGGDPGAFIAGSHIAPPSRLQKAIPEGEERLREVGLNAPALMMDIMIRSIIRGEVLQGIPGEVVAGVIIHRLDGTEGEQEHRLPVVHVGREKCNTSTSGVQEESLNRVIVERTKRIGNIKAVMTRVEGD